MAAVPGLRSPYEKVGRLIYFGRMLDKIRLHAAGKLAPEYVANLGDEHPTVFDARCCRFLGVAYRDLVARTLQGGCDEEILAWVETHGAARTDDECWVWNCFMMKIGWRDSRSERLRSRVTELGFEGRGIETFFELIENDEGRESSTTQPWRNV